jgi:protein-disulfide isomerase
MDRRLVPAPIAAVLLIALCAPAFSPAARAQSAEQPAAPPADEELMRRIEALEQGQQRILQQLGQIQRQLRERPAAAPERPAGPEVAGKVIDLGANPVKGEPTAPLTLVEFTDYQCPFCSRHVHDTHPEIAEQYIDAGKLRYATLDLPIESIHPLAFRAAEATHCAEQQGKFWEMHDRLFANPRALEPWSGHAEALGLDAAAFDECLTSERYAAAVRRDMAEAGRVGASGTPSFVIARTDPNDPTKVEGLSFIRGAQPFAVFKAQLDAALAAPAAPEE